MAKFKIDIHFMLDKEHYDKLKQIAKKYKNAHKFLRKKIEDEPL